MNKISLSLFLLILVLIGGAVWFYYSDNLNNDPNEITSDLDIINDEDNLESEIPTPDPEISYIPNQARDLIKINNPQAGATVTSPLIITGEARGTWFFEATAPVILTNWDGLIIAEGYITAKGDWMTEDFVPFEGSLTFTTSESVVSNRASLILKRANPSGLSENDMAAEMTIFLDEN